MDTYQTGSGTGQISLKVDITTFAAAASRAIVIDLNSTAPGREVAKSDNVTGDIPTENIGRAADLQNLRLNINSQVQFWGDEAQRKSQFEDLGVKYVVDGGTDGEKTYADPEIDVDAEYTLARISKSIDLK